MYPLGAPSTARHLHMPLSIPCPDEAATQRTGCSEQGQPSMWRRRREGRVREANSWTEDLM